MYFTTDFVTVPQKQMDELTDLIHFEIRETARGMNQASTFFFQSHKKACCKREENFYSIFVNLDHLTISKKQLHEGIFPIDAAWIKISFLSKTFTEQQIEIGEWVEITVIKNHIHN